MAYAEDELEDELVDVEGEGENEDVAVTEEDEEDTNSKASPDADTMILFTKPIVTGAAQMGKTIRILNNFQLTND